MLKALVKKQFIELFRGYFVNSKTGEARKKGKTIALFILFAFLMLFLCAAFFGMSMLLDPLFGTDYQWLYFALMGIVAIALGTFGSVFNTFTVLYQAKDNEQLLSLPIPSSVILTARIVEVFGMSLLYSAVVWLPASVYFWIFGEPTALAVVFDILLIPVIAFFVTVLTCALGWIVALISSKLKNRSIFVAILSLLFFAVYYMVCFRFSDILETLMTNGEQVSGALKSWAFVIFAMARGAEGSLLHMLLFTLITAALCALCFWLLARSFVKIVTTSHAEKKTVYKEKETKALSLKKTLLNRELSRFTSSATYMLNCMIGNVFLVIIAAVAVIKSGQLAALLSMIPEEMPEAAPFIPLIVVATVCMITGINTISVPSISLEGKTLWMLQSMPIQPIQVLGAKIRLHLVMNAVPGLIAGAALCFALKLEFALSVVILGYIFLFINITATLGLILGMKRPNFTWTNEATPIKQSFNVVIAWLMAWGIVLITCGVFYLLRNTIALDDYMIIMIVVMALATRMLNKWLATKGQEEFASL